MLEYMPCILCDQEPGAVPARNDSPCDRAMEEAICLGYPGAEPPGM